MLSHITINVSDLGASKRFYDQALASLGLRVVRGSAEQSFWGYGEVHPEFEISQGGEGYLIARRVHVAFRASGRAAVDAFYRAAIAAGGEDNGAPGPRPNYGETYYAAFVRDPDGNNIEAAYDEG